MLINVGVKNKMTEFKLSDFRRYYLNGVPIFHEDKVKEFIRLLKEIKGDDLDNWYEEYLKTLSSMEIYNENHGCNKFVINKLKERINKLTGDLK